jgi:hypothetical protein
VLTLQSCVMHNSCMCSSYKYIQRYAMAAVITKVKMYVDCTKMHLLGGIHMVVTLGLLSLFCMSDFYSRNISVQSTHSNILLSIIRATN